MDVLRDICYTKRFEKELSEIEVDVKRSDEIMRGIEWAIVRHPEDGEPLMNELYARPRTHVDDLEDMVVYYKYDDKKIYLMSIKISD